MPSRLQMLKTQLAWLKNHDADPKEIEELEGAIKRSQRGRSSKNKGANFERKIVEKLGELFPDLKFGRTPSSGGYKKDVESSSLRGDVVCLTDNKDFLLHMELKNHKGLGKLWNFYSQAESDCLSGKTPILILHRGLEAGKWKAGDFVLVKFDDFFNLLDLKKIIK